jgi:hypothetical protein
MKSSTGRKKRLKGITMFASIKDFTADKFTATKWEKADKKANFAKQFIRFVESDFNRKQFPKIFYVRLSMTFGHIAHYNQSGFFDVFFTDTESKVRFLRQTLNHECWGDEDYTFSDVEKALKSWLFQNGVLAKYERRLAEEMEAAERADLAQLKGKYETESANGKSGREAG